MPLRVMTWNILRDDGDGDWPRRREAVCGAILREDPDILALQEATPRQLQDLLARLPTYSCVRGASNGREEHVAILHRPQSARLVDHGCVWLSDTPDVPLSRSWGNEIARCATWARFLSRDGALEVVNAHFDHESDRFRLEAAHLLDRMFPDALLLGDFNTTPGSRPHEILTRSHRDPFPTEGFETMRGDDGTPHARYDWILLPPSLGAVDARRVEHEEGEPLPSDHLALVADVSPRGGPA